jgi:hypothetical protein
MSTPEDNAMVESTEPTVRSIFFDAQAMREHFDGEASDTEEWIDAQDDGALARVGVRAAALFDSDDRIWQVFGECVAAAVTEARTEVPSSAPTEGVP